MTRHSLSHSLQAATPVATGDFEAFLPVFKTGRAGQPPAWKVRFLRRVVAAYGAILGLSARPPLRFRKPIMSLNPAGIRGLVHQRHVARDVQPDAATLTTVELGSDAVGRSERLSRLGGQR